MVSVLGTSAALRGALREPLCLPPAVFPPALWTHMRTHGHTRISARASGGQNGVIWQSHKGKTRLKRAGVGCHGLSMGMPLGRWKIGLRRGGGGHGCRWKGGGVWEMDTCDRTHVTSQLTGRRFLKKKIL